jgi:hypothetical protein
VINPTLMLALPDAGFAPGDFADAAATTAAVAPTASSTATTLSGWRMCLASLRLTFLYKGFGGTDNTLWRPKSMVLYMTNGQFCGTDTNG